MPSSYYIGQQQQQAREKFSIKFTEIYDAATIIPDPNQPEQRLMKTVKGKPLYMYLDAEILECFEITAEYCNFIKQHPDWNTRFTQETDWEFRDYAHRMVEWAKYKFLLELLEGEEPESPDFALFAIAVHQYKSRKKIDIAEQLLAIEAEAKREEAEKQAAKEAKIRAKTQRKQRKASKYSQYPVRMFYRL